MTAEELISELKSMSVDEREKVIHFLSQETGANLTFASNEAVQKALDEVFSEHADLFQKLAQ